MISFLLGFLTCALLAGGAYSYAHRASKTVNPLLDGLKAMVENLMGGVIAELEALPARMNTAVADLEAKLAGVNAALEAEKQARAAALSAISAKVAEVATAPATPPAPPPVLEPAPTPAAADPNAPVP